MDRKRKLDSTIEEEEKGSLPLMDTITHEEILAFILAIILADDYKQLQENIENGLIKDINMTISTYYPKSLLMEACNAGSVECVKVLLANNADVNYESDHNRTIVRTACASGNIDIAKLILSRAELDINSIYFTLYCHLFSPPSNVYLSTEIVKQLITRLPDVNRRVLGDYVLLNQAAYYGHLDVVRLLIENGADPNVTDLEGCDALHEASLNGRLDVINVLLESDLPHKISIKSINNAFFECCVGGYNDAVSYLLGKGAQVNEADGFGCFGIDYAIRSNSIPLAKLLIKNSFDVNSMHVDRPVLVSACLQKRAEIVQLLLDSGANPNVHYPDGSCLLLELVQETCDNIVDHVTYITLLLDCEANINIAHKHTGQTALMLAGAAASADLVKLLLEHGADVTQVNREGKSVLDMLGRTRSHAHLAELCRSFIDSNRVDSKTILK